MIGLRFYSWVCEALVCFFSGNRYKSKAVVFLLVKNTMKLNERIFWRLSEIPDANGPLSEMGI